MRSPLETFTGLLDRSVQEVATLAADARTFDASRIGRIADIWDNNTFPLMRAACALRPLRAGRARAGLQWMAELGPARRELMVSLDPALDGVLPAAALEPPVHRDYRARVSPGLFPLTPDVVDGLVTDYDLAGASVRSLTARPAETGVQVALTLAAPRRYVPGAGRVAVDGSRRPWPAALLNFAFVGVADLRFDAGDRTGARVTCGQAGPAVAIGRGGRLQATSASVWPDDPWWHESASGRAADAATPRGRPERRDPVGRPALTEQQRAAARALLDLMVQLRLAGYHPQSAARIPVREICRVAAGAGGAILAASEQRRSAREKAFSDLAQRWRGVPPHAAPAAVPPGPATLRHAGYIEPHEDHDLPRESSAVLLAAVPDADPAKPWRLTSEEVPRPASFHITAAAFDGAQHLHRDTDTLTIGDNLAVRPQ